MKLFID